ncbi:hypothetical protein TELCIR_15005, partial [Teladorsagia circumcincta]
SNSPTEAAFESSTLSTITPSAAIEHLPFSSVPTSFASQATDELTTTTSFTVDHQFTAETTPAVRETITTSTSVEASGEEQENVNKLPNVEASIDDARLGKTVSESTFASAPTPTTSYSIASSAVEESAEVSSTPVPPSFVVENESEKTAAESHTEQTTASPNEATEEEQAERHTVPTLEVNVDGATTIANVQSVSTEVPLEHTTTIATSGLDTNTPIVVVFPQKAGDAITSSTPASVAVITGVSGESTPSGEQNGVSTAPTTLEGSGEEQVEKSNVPNLAANIDEKPGTATTLPDTPVTTTESAFASTEGGESMTSTTSTAFSNGFSSVAPTLTENLSETGASAETTPAEGLSETSTVIFVEGSGTEPSHNAKVLHVEESIGEHSTAVPESEEATETFKSEGGGETPAAPAFVSSTPYESELKKYLHKPMEQKQACTYNIQNVTPDRVLPDFNHVESVSSIGECARACYARRCTMAQYNSQQHLEMDLGQAKRAQLEMNLLRKARGEMDALESDQMEAIDEEDFHRALDLQHEIKTLRGNVLSSVDPRFTTDHHQPVYALLRH